MRKAIALIASLLLVVSAFTQNTILQCLSVGELDGAVSLKFSGPSGTDNFNIYRANQLNGTYQLIHTTSNGQVNTYLDNTINAASQSYAYYVESVNNGQITGVSQKNRTILLSVVNLNNGLIQLNWNDPGINTAASYEIWAKGENGTFAIHHYSDIESFVDSIESCPMIRYYQIRVPTNGCVSISNIRGGTYSDLTQPEPIIPQNASIDLNTGQIHLSWLLPSEASADIIKYQIWIINEDGGSTTFPEAEVYGYHNLSLILENEFVCDTSLTFAITAQDSCGNNSNYNLEEYYIRTLNLKGIEYNICNDECIIQWDSIIGWLDLPLQGIRIFKKEGDGAFEQAAVVGPTETSASIFGFERGKEYRFYIEAFSEGNIRTSTSCIRKITGRKPTVTEFNWLRQVSVINGEVHLKWQVDSIAYIPQFAISRSGDGLEFNIIDTIIASGDTMHYYTDLESKYYQSPQYYYIQPFDSCLNLGDESNISATIYTKVSPNGDGEALVEWTPYSLMDSMLYYNVYRVIDTNVYPIPIAELSPDELSYSDYYDNAVSPTSKVGYFVEAVGYFNDSIAQADTARSNTNFLAKVTNVFLPSGFKPKGGVNNIFKPIYTGIKSTNYSFKILNRWGMMIYESNQPLLGWNGKYDGEFVTPGAYVYVVDYETIYGKKIRKSGVFYVLY
jgi:hypothetical protein